MVNNGLVGSSKFKRWSGVGSGGADNKASLLFLYTRKQLLMCVAKRQDVKEKKIPLGMMKVRQIQVIKVRRVKSVGICL